MAFIYENASLRTRNAFRLIELSPGSQDDPDIHLIIRSTNLTAASKTFQAVSYTWGAEIPSKSIFCGLGDDQRLDVSLNCYTALRHLRDPDETMTLWIDAICIDQSNVLERNMQVRIMGEIYSAARRVIVFLGERDPETNILFRHFAATDGLINDGEDPDDLPAPSASMVLCLRNFLKRPWFFRIWVIQEVLNASEVVFMCGNDMASDEALESCLYGHRRATRVIEHFPAPIEMGLIYFSDRRWQCSSVLQEMLLLIVSTCKSEASDPRDRILALIPLIRSKAHDLERLIDYSKSTEAIFSDFSLLLLADIGLIMLRLLRRPHSREMSSWMVDVSQDTYQEQNIEDFLDCFPLIQSGTFQQDFTVSGSTCIGSSHRLRAKGSRYACIIGFGPVIQFETGQWSANEKLVKDLVIALDFMRLGMAQNQWPALVMRGKLKIITLSLVLIISVALEDVEEDDLHTLLTRGHRPIVSSVLKIRRRAPHAKNLL